jgi:outer membrane lipoprotein-sorting protein
LKVAIWIVLGLATLPTLPLATAPAAQQTRPSTQPESRPTSRGDSDDAAFARALSEIDQKARRIKDLKADFKQSKHTALLKKPMQSEGTVRIKVDSEPPIMRWDTTKPQASTTWIGGNELKIYSPREALLEIYSIQSAWSQLAASPLPKMESLREQFSISSWAWPDLDPAVADRRIGLKLVPQKEQIREHLLEVRILIDRDTACAVAAEVLYPDQDRLELWFTNVRLNSGIDGQELELKVPAGTAISRPLEVKGTSLIGD